MPSKNNRVNHDFQIVYFLAGACHTADGAYAQLKALLEERQAAIAGIEAAELTLRAKEAAVQEATTESARLLAMAELVTMRADAATRQRNIAAAHAEVRTLERCIELIQPLRKFAHLPDPEAFEAAMPEEWCLELLYRAENFLITTGTIPPDHFGTMRQHPQFAERIAPALLEMDALLQSPQGREQLMQRVTQRKPAFMALPGMARLALPPPEEPPCP